MHSQELEISFLSVGIIVNLYSDDSKIWSNKSFDSNNIRKELVRKISLHKRTIELNQIRITFYLISDKCYKELECC